MCSVKKKKNTKRKLFYLAPNGIKIELAGFCMGYVLDMERQKIANKTALPVGILFCDWKEGENLKAGRSSSLCLQVLR